MDLTQEQAQGLAMFLVPNIDNEISTTKKILAAVPQGQLSFKLGDICGRTAQELAWHIVTVRHLVCRVHRTGRRIRGAVG